MRPHNQENLRGAISAENNELIKKFMQEYIYEEDGKLAEDIKVKKYQDGSEYTGNTEKGKKSGVGMYRFYSGDVYFGDWQFDLMHGKGVLIDRDGERYEGYFDRGIKHGQGNFFSNDGSVYKGEWHNGRREGRALLHFANGDKYEGYFHADRMHGNGVFVTPTEQYIGEFANGHREGEGELRYKNGSIFQGGFKKGVPEGSIS